MKTQAMFDKVVRHLRKQGQKATDDQSCLYRKVTEEGKVLKCAVGCLIPESKYDPKMERSGLDTIREQFPKALPKLTEYQFGILKDLQCVHDLDEVDQWEDEFRDIAADIRGLKYRKPRG